MKELEAEFQRSMIERGIRLRYCGETTSVEYDKMFIVWLAGYNAHKDVLQDQETKGISDGLI